MTSIKFRALTHNDHKLFFEALGEYGKDFQNIQQYMTQKGGKSGNKTINDQTNSKLNHNNSLHNLQLQQQHQHQQQNQHLPNYQQLDLQERKEQEKKEDDKKREQIRNFYNKLYSKLASLIEKLDDHVEKITQELYLLINYGEIWKKLGFKFNNKTKKLLEELIHQGYTILRFKSKNVRLRTPPCKALKKINKIGVDEETNLVTSRELPKDVIVEFHPSTNRDWLRVQSISQNPRVRAKLSMQKRISNILVFLENKWNISPDKLNRSVDSWLKMPQNQQIVDDLNQQQQYLPNLNNTSPTNKGLSSEICTNHHFLAKANPMSNIETADRLRLRPSAQHELKEVNITRVVPDYHLDLSLSAYIKRLGVPEQKTNNEHSTDAFMISGASNQSLGATSNNSRLPVSLTTPDASVILERSITSDQPSIAQARKHLNFLQTLAGTFEGCENSRTACEDTQDKSLPGIPHSGDSNLKISVGGFSSSRMVSFANINSDCNSSSPNIVIPALFDENAAIDSVITNSQAKDCSLQSTQIVESQNNHTVDCHKEKSVDFQIPTNVTLGDWFKSSEDDNGDNASDAFPTNNDQPQTYQMDAQYNDDNHNEMKLSKDESNETKKHKPNECPQNHIIEIKKIAEGWTRNDQSSMMSIGELYLAFKCPEKIILEYEFESSHVKTQRSLDISDHTNYGSQVLEDPCKNKSLIFRLLTGASLSLAHLERMKQEQQHKLHDQPGVKLNKRRKGQLDTIKTQSLAQTMTPHEVETTNQRVEEALKRLQPTRLRARFSKG